MIKLCHQQKSYILDIGGTALATDFLTKTLQILDTSGFFIFLMKEKKINVENFLSSSINERFIKTIVLNIRENVEGKLMIDVHAKRYFSKDRRVVTFMIGSFVEKHFLVFNTTVRTKIR